MMKSVRRAGAALLVLSALTSPAAAEEPTLYDRLWPRVPDSQQITMGQRIADQLTELGNQLGYHLDQLSSDMLALRFDGRRRKAFVRLGGGNEQYLNFRLASDVHFTEGVARINSRVDLTFRGKNFKLTLPEVEMVPANYRGDRGVEFRIPIFRRRF